MRRIPDGLAAIRTIPPQGNEISGIVPQWKPAQYRQPPPGDSHQAAHPRCNRISSSPYISPPRSTAVSGATARCTRNR